ncbi:MAG TPA: HNH endonuclease [Polyangiaceae bacterium]
MASLSTVSDSELLAHVPVLLTRERAVTAELIEYLAEIDRRRLYLEQACASLRSFCIERLGYSEDEASKRVRVARLAGQLASVLDELRSGAIHLTGLFLLAPYLTVHNADALLGEARGLSRRAIEQLIARWFPRPDVESRIDPVASQSALPLGQAGSGRPAAPIGPGAERFPTRAKLEPLSASRYRVEFTASQELYAEIEQAQELLSHVLPRADLPALFSRAIKALIEKEVRRRRGADRKRKRRVQKPGSRHVPVEVKAEVWRRDGSQCTFVDEEGRRCSARRFLTIEHVQPHACGGPSTLENLSLLCSSHNAHTARQVFGEAHIEKKRRERKPRDVPAKQAEVRPTDAAQSDSRELIETKVCSALCKMGFRKHEVVKAVGKLRARAIEPKPESLLRAALALLVPPGVSP